MSGKAWNRHLFSLAVMAAIFIFTPSQAAADSVSSATEKGTILDKTSDGLEDAVIWLDGLGQDEEPGIVDKAHEGISKAILASASWMDSFFDDERYQSEINQTRLKVKFGLRFKEYSDPKMDVLFDLRMRLPMLEDRFQLILTGDPDDDEGLDNAPVDDARDQFEGRNDRYATAALRFFALDSEIHNISFDAGVRFREGLDTALYGGAQYRFYHPLPFWDKWATRFRQRVRYYTDNGFESRSTLDLERPLTESLFLRLSAEAEAFQGDDNIYHDYKGVLFQGIDDIQSLEYRVENYFETKPHNRLQQVRLKMKYRRQVWRDWLFVEVEPELSFPSSRGFEAVPGVLFRVEINLGYNNLKKMKK